MAFLWILGWAIFLFLLVGGVIVAVVGKNGRLRTVTLGIIGVIMGALLITLIMTEHMVNEKPAAKNASAAVKTLP